MKSHESPTISTLLVLALFIFLSKTEIEARFLQEICSSSCGELNKITYPFRLTTDPVECGDPDYQLSCQDNKPILEFHSGQYFVKQISYDRHLIRLVDVNLASGSCNLPHSSVSVDEAYMYPLWFQPSFMLFGRFVSSTDDMRLPPSPLSFPDYIATEEPRSDSLTELLIPETVEQSL
ncbi:hypothetical protein GH714_018213 [Hevea brasiliensis]|uniref:Wall-associated receptor kinase galacturonan-binding domain-containing protein n=1 Tax=Hevea brasiliensis TaxID=3981 RepID=A0A6A6MAZ6_HEVBR|nr:hypothetical protein GH714_018213 [Hevea brasiliensis]